MAHRTGGLLEWGGLKRLGAYFKTCRSIKALSHCAIFSATCLAMVENVKNVALQVAEILC